MKVTYHWPVRVKEEAARNLASNLNYLVTTVAELAPEVCTRALTRYRKGKHVCDLRVEVDRKPLAKSGRGKLPGNTALSDDTRLYVIRRALEKIEAEAYNSP